MTNSHLVSFEAFPGKVLFEGFGQEILHGLSVFLTRTPADTNSRSEYRVCFEGGGRFPTAVIRRAVLTRRPFRRHLTTNGEDLVLMPGCRLRLAPGRSKAAVEYRAGGVAVDGFVLATLLEMALTHALAMGGYVVNHAAAIEIGGAAMLAVGPTHAGKSTLSAAALAAGGAVVSDDSVILGRSQEGNASVGALRRDLWLRDGSQGILPKAMGSRLLEYKAFGERRWGLERATSPDLFRTRVRPQAIVLLRRDLRVRGFALRRVSSAKGLAGLIRASSVLFLSGRYSFEREMCMPGLVELANSAPCYEVRMGRALVEEPDSTVRRLFEDVCS